MRKTVLLAAAAVLALSAGSALATGMPVTSSKGFDIHPTRLTLPSAGLKTLYSQNDNNAGGGIDSQMFESSLSKYDDMAADDFVVPTGHTWKVLEVDVTGLYFNGAGPAASENVIFYKDKRGKPGRVVNTQSAIHGTDATGSFVIKTKAVRLRAGHYWLTVQANCAFRGGCGEWGWADRTVLSNSPAQWQNPGGGFAVCPTWGPITTCIAGNTNPDLMFAVKGKG